MKNPLKQHALALLLSIVLLAVSACLYLYLYQETQTLIEKAIDARSVISSDDKNRAQGKDLLSVYQTTAASRARLGGLFVSVDNAVVFIKTIEAMGASSGATVSISSISNDPPQSDAPGSVGTVTAHITAVGPWAGVMRTLALFEDFPYRSAINNVALGASTLSSDHVGKSVRNWQLSFDIAASTLIPSVDKALVSTSTKQ